MPSESVEAVEGAMRTRDGASEQIHHLSLYHIKQHHGKLHIVESLQISW